MTSLTIHEQVTPHDFLLLPLSVSSPACPSVVHQHHVRRPPLRWYIRQLSQYRDHPYELWTDPFDMCLARCPPRPSPPSTRMVPNFAVPCVLGRHRVHHARVHRPACVCGMETSPQHSGEIPRYVRRLSCMMCGGSDNLAT